MSLAASNLLSAVGWTLVNFVWQGALIGCVAAIVLTALRNAKPQQRYVVACSALLVCLLWPAVELALRISDGSSAGPAPHLAGAVIQARLGAPGGALDYLQSRLPWLVTAWAAIAAALALRLALGLAWIGRATWRFKTNEQWQERLSLLASRMGVGRAVRLRIVDNLASPVTAGWWRPVVLVPASLVSGMPPDLLEALLAHELGHVKRFDYLVNLGQNVVEILLFYHPAVWWISGRIRAEREHIADELAANALGEPRRLARALSELERVQFSGVQLAQAAAGGDLMGRIKRLVGPSRQALSWKASIPVLGLAVLCGAMYAHASPTPRPVAMSAHSGAVVDFRSCTKPEYPAEDLESGHQGTVTLSILVSADGKAVDSRVFRSSGYRGLDRSARDAITKCQFKPATTNGRPVQEWMKLQYVWTTH
jgi:D-alanyl-D-alanine endopeptidase (penicillin-binding protein 7)